MLISEILDNLSVSHVVTSVRVSIEVQYDDGDDKWIGLRINPDGSGKEVGVESWEALPTIRTKPVPFKN